MPKHNTDLRRQQLKQFELPDWAKLLQYPSDKILHGSYKYVYIYHTEGIALSIEENIPEDRIKHRLTLYDMLKDISNCNVNYPSKTATINKYFIAKLNYCPMGDLFDNISSITDMQTYEDLFRTYYTLHEIGIYHIDVKPGNLLVCNCGGKIILAISDIEDALINPWENKIITPPGNRVIRTRPYCPYEALKTGLKYGFSRDRLAYMDYFALSLIMLVVYTWTVEGEVAESTDIVYTFQNTGHNDRILKLNNPPESVKLAKQMFNTDTYFNKSILRKIERFYSPNKKLQKPLIQRVKNYLRNKFGYAQKLKV